jgi:hypothetical protein
MGSDSSAQMMQEIATAFSSVSSANIVQIAAQNPEFQDAVSAALQQVSTAYGIAFTAESAASLLGAAADAAQTAAAMAEFKGQPPPISLSTPIALLFVGTALLFLPTLEAMDY